MTTNTTSTASQAPAVSIHCQEFHELAMDYRGAQVIGVTVEAYAKLVEYIDAKLAQAREEGFGDGTVRLNALRNTNEGLVKTIAHIERQNEWLEARATAAEAKLEAMRQGVEDLLQYILDHDWGGIPEPVPQIAALRAIFQPQPQADESGLPG